jgi:hypothetical protein
MSRVMVHMSAVAAVCCLGVGALAQEDAPAVYSMVSSEIGSLRVEASGSSLTPVDELELEITLDANPGWYPDSTIEGLGTDQSWGGLRVVEIQQLAPRLAPDNLAMRHSWIARVQPFLPGEETIGSLGVRLFSDTDPQASAQMLYSEPLTIEVTSLLAGVDDFTPGTLAAPLDPEPQAAIEMPAWAWFVAGAGAMGVLALGSLVWRRHEDPAVQQRRIRQALRAQLAMLGNDGASLESLQQAHRLLTQLESIVPVQALLPSIREDLRTWHDRYERTAFRPSFDQSSAASLLEASHAIGQRLDESASMRREAS